MTLLTIRTDGTAERTQVSDAILWNRLVEPQNVRIWMFEDGTKGIAFEIEIPDGQPGFACVIDESGGVA